MTRNKTLMAAGLLTGVAAISMASVSMASASPANNQDSIITKLAQRFNLNEAEVRSVFEEERAAKEAERQTAVSERLQDAVEDGDITGEQKTLIESKLKELTASRDAERTELEAWARENDIDLRYLKVLKHGGSGHLNDAVEDGKITADQKSKIDAKLSELKDAREAQREALEQWAEDNDIDMSLLRMGGLKGGFKEKMR